MLTKGSVCEICWLDTTPVASDNPWELIPNFGGIYCDRGITKYFEVLMTRFFHGGFVAVLSLAAILLTAPGCNDGGGVDTFSKIEINPSSTDVTVSLDSDYVITIINAGEGEDLTVSDIVLNYTPTSADETDAGPAFQLIKNDSLPKKIGPTAGQFEEDIVRFTVRYRAANDGLDRSASVTIVNNNTDPTFQNLTINFSGRRCRPILDVDDKYEFGMVRVGEVGNEDVSLVNTGSCALVVDWIRVEDDAENQPQTIKVSIQGQEFPGVSDYKQYNLETPVTIEPGSGVMWPATFTPVNSDTAQAQLIIHTNNTEVPDGLYSVTLIGNSTGPKLVVVPNPVDFGGKLISKAAGMRVTLKSEGTENLELTSISLDPATSPDFSLDITELDPQPTVETPLVLEPNDSVDVTVKFTPNEENPRDVDNKPIPDTGAILIANNGIEAVVNVPLSGYGVTVDCPKPVIIIEQGEQVKPQTVLNIHGEQSTSGSAGGSIVSYSWTVDQPEENKFILLPTASSPTVTHEVNIGGEYVYCLDVCDSQYCSSDPKCGGAVCKTVNVIPDKAIHCELTWNTPADDDQFNEGEDEGADMDLHFAHPFAAMTDIDGDGKPDPWFHVPYDAFWFQKNPQWETPNPDGKDNPSLDRDDTDGAGPENINLDSPVAGRVYRIGVHYWDDHGYGASYPRLKCYIWGQPVFDFDMNVTGQAMYKCDMWNAVEIAWPQQTVTLLRNTDNSLKITKGYEEPSFSEIGGGGCSVE